MKRVMKGCKTFGNVLSVIAIIALLVMVCVTIADVILREIFGSPITGVVEITKKRI